jgi:histidinol-phosphate aminotransferase
MLTRRSFVQTAGLGVAAYIGARGRENSIWAAFEPTLEAVEPGVICLSSNENPGGPGKVVLDAVKAAFGPNGARPGRYDGSQSALIEAIAKKNGVKPENVVLGCGSTQILRSCTHLFTAKDKALVGTIPTYEECSDYAALMGHPVRAVSMDANFKIDLDKFADAAKGAGLVFYCNPNNPAATYVGARATRDFLAKLAKDTPETYVLVDEAYFDYVTDPDHDTHIPVALENPHVIIARTFSKAYGMAGLRLGYAVAHADTIKKMREWDAGSGTSSLNVLAMQAGIAAINQDDSFITAERARNKEVRDFTMKWFADRGMQPTDSQANFMFVNIGRPVKEFREACLKQQVKVARDFPPFEKTHCRISYGTMDEMKKAVAVFGEVLQKKAAAA